MRARRIPLRKCIACQEMMPKKQLIRVVRTPEEEVFIDLTGKKSGRGAYLCGNVTCFRLAKKHRSLDRALKATVPNEIYDDLEQQFLQVEDQFRANMEAMNDE